MGIYIRKNRWWIDFSVNGKRIRESVGRIDVLTKGAVKNILLSRKLELVQNNELIKEDKKYKTRQQMKNKLKKYNNKMQPSRKIIK